MFINTLQSENLDVPANVPARSESLVFFRLRLADARRVLSSGGMCSPAPDLLQLIRCLLRRIVDGVCHLTSQGFLSPHPRAKLLLLMRSIPANSQFLRSFVVMPSGSLERPLLAFGLE